MHEIARATGVPLTTLCNCKRHYCPDSQCRPGHPTPGSRRVYTDQEEKEIIDHIRSHYFSKHLPLTTSNMRTLILKRYQAHLPMRHEIGKHPSRFNVENFVASGIFCAIL
jgi:hypothetical protein